MVLDLKPVFLNEGESIGIDTEFDFSDVDLSGRYPLSDPVKVTGSIYNRASVVYLSIVCDFSFTAECDRCARECSNHYTLPVERILVTKLESSEDNDDILVVEGMKLDLKELVYTEVLLFLPTKNLCKPDCKGICPSCGRNLNDGECGCNNQNIDPRLRVLEQLLNN
ncbi:MAG TPA: DUF177 domain-containing protein [Clostridiales bacterium]|nr:DUF177 domain-containing protein [Clostridiales bacterium]